ncbi:hypothetical protein [Mucilaginibacter ginkgonis]|uniref:Copper chaperone CopZ n=1 Tax=Mucilaginibacter ginkgonis TaxID=2682091 RepID=A0A6I4INN0_9SPHI|nr:hypothetical protein [Mucilaginibacter ginkgonis]QQL48566.1 hypothetical protein GO620_010265 [Mucilaginibacter ginkgonis]
MDILVFKTNIQKEKQVNEVNSLLTRIPEISNWNFDLEDRDRILRVQAEDISAMYIEMILQDEGFICSELED